MHLSSFVPATHHALHVLVTWNSLVLLSHDTSLFTCMPSHALCLGPKFPSFFGPHSLSKKVSYFKNTVSFRNSLKFCVGLDAYAIPFQASELTLNHITLL